MELSKEQIESILNDAKPSIITGLKDEVVRQAQWQMNPVVAGMIENEVKAFMVAEIIPVVKQRLTEEKDGIISTAIMSANSIALELSIAMTAVLKKKLESSYERTKIFDTLFK